MATSHHHHNTTCSTTTHGCFCCTHHPSPPPSTTSEPLLQAYLSNLLLQQQQQHNQTSQCHCQTQQHQNKHFDYTSQKQDVRFLLSSLLSRIDALEGSLHSFYSSSSSSRSLVRDAAARVIQTHFRAFLVRRSRTLRQLKQLAIVKSRFNSLKSSVSKNAHVDFWVLSQKASDLLLKLDSIQGGDSMVRDGKRSISVELVKFLEYVDGFIVRGRQVSLKSAAKNVKIMGTNRNRTRFGYGNRDFGRNNYQREELIENLKDRIDKLSGVFKAEDEDIELEGFHQLIDEVEEEEDEVNPRVSRYRDGVAQNRVQAHMYPRPKVKRSVSFAENGNVIKYFEHGSENDASVSSEDNEQVVHNEVQGMKGDTFE